jgi:hypothetical protein
MECGGSTPPLTARLDALPPNHPKSQKRHAKKQRRPAAHGDRLPLVTHGGFMKPIKPTFAVRVAAGASHCLPASRLAAGFDFFDPRNPAGAEACRYS